MESSLNYSWRRCQIYYIPNFFLPDAQASISGPPEIYVKKGSTISLTCSINIHSNPPSSVLWYHGQSVIDFDSPRGGISLETEKTEAGTTSKLLVTKALLSDSGNYTCMPSNATPASTVVHVLNGKYRGLKPGFSEIISRHFTLAFIMYIFFLRNLIQNCKYWRNKLIIIIFNLLSMFWWIYST